jgi:hypothetical protein
MRMRHLGKGGAAVTASLEGTWRTGASSWALLRPAGRGSSEVDAQSGRGQPCDVHITKHTSAQGGRALTTQDTTGRARMGMATMSAGATWGGRWYCMYGWMAGLAGFVRIRGGKGPGPEQHDQMASRGGSMVSLCTEEGGCAKIYRGGSIQEKACIPAATELHYGGTTHPHQHWTMRNDGIMPTVSLC